MTEKFNENLRKIRKSGVEPALNDDVMPSNAKLCQVPCQKWKWHFLDNYYSTKKRAEPKPRPNYVKNVC